MNSDIIFLDHGSGGKVSHRLISDIMLPIFDNAILSQLNDGAVFDIEGKRFAFSTDTYVVDPIFFPGGNIGSLAINGTVNDLSMCGSIPLYVSVGLVIEEGFPMGDLEKILRSMNAAARKAGVKVVATHQQVADDPTGALMEGIFELLDQYESDMNGFHTLRAMKENARQGYFNGSKPKFGFMVVAEDEQGEGEKAAGCSSR